MLHGVVRSRRKQFRLPMQCHVSTDGQQADYEYILVTRGFKIAKFLIKLSYFPQIDQVGSQSLVQN